MLKATDRHTTSPYGKSKLMVEQILTDLQKAQPDWSIALLRYFNPVSTYRRVISAKMQGIPNNLMPYIAQVAVGRSRLAGDFW